MACIAVFLLVLFTTSKTVSTSSHSCNSSTQLSASGDDMDMTNVSQLATSLQYCMIDNCTIKRTDTGEELEIFHTTESLLVVVPTDGRTSEIVLLLDNEVPCSPVPTDNGLMMVVAQVTFFLLLGSTSAYIIVVHLLFAELRTKFGKTLMVYNALLFMTQVFATISIIMHRVVAVDSQVVCQTVVNILMFLTMSRESYATCILFHCTLIMYYSYKCRSDIPKKLFLFYNCFVFGVLAIFATIVIGYDLYSGNGKQTVLPDGYCVFFTNQRYRTLRVRDFQHSCNKIAQMSMFVIFLILYYKHHKTSKVADTNSVSTRVSKQLIRIAIAMGATIGLARIVWTATSVFAPTYVYISTFAGLLLFVFQQCTIMVSFVCTQKMSRLCRERFYPQQSNTNDDDDAI